MHLFDIRGIRFLPGCFYSLFSLLMIVSSIYSGRLYASQTDQKVFFAGVSFLGSFAQISERYPFAQRLNDPKNTPRINTLDNQFLAQLSNKKPAFYRLDTGLANLRRSESIVMSLAIEKERISREWVGSKQKVIYEVGAQLVFMDFASMTLVANYPIELALNHVVDKQDSQDIRLQRFTELYMGTDTEEGLIQLATQVALQVRPFTKSKIRFQVADVALSDKAKKHLPKDVSENQFTHYIGQYFTARLADNYDVSVLPFTKGYAVGNKMAGRFANGDVYNLALPEPDYQFSFLINDFRKVPKDNNLLYAARVGTKFNHRATGKAYINGFYHYAVAKLALADNADVDDWAASEDAVEALLNDWIGQLANPDRQWHKEHSSNKSSYTEFNLKKELFNGR